MELIWRAANPVTAPAILTELTSEQAEEIIFALWLRYLQCKKAKQLSLMDEAVELARRLSSEFAQMFQWETTTLFDDRVNRYPTATLTLRFP